MPENLPQPDAAPEAAEPQLDSGITGVVLTMNGERLLERCLASLSFCDTILTVDSGSTDASLDIARAHNAVIVHNAWRGFEQQFRFAETLVKTRWFFILDQDEICPAPLGKLIVDAIAESDRLADTPQDTAVAFSVGRKSWYFDRFMKHGGWYPDHILRVFRTGFVEFRQDAHIHYRALGHTEHLGTPGAELIHYPYTSFFHQLSKLNSYAEEGATALRREGRKGGVLRGVGHGLARFCRIYIIKRGFLDGRAGFLAACHGSFYAFSKYARTLESNWGAPYDKS
jgi:glycosyltransferase involved in cell wall biosynthesis